MQNISDVEIKKTQWDLSPLFSGDSDPKISKELQKVEKETHKFLNKWKNREDFLKEPALLKEALEDYEKWETEIGPGGKQSYYFSLRSSQDQTDVKLKGIENKLSEFVTARQNEIEFFLLRVGKIPESEQERFLAYEPLKKYEHFLRRLFLFQKHMLSEEEEKIINLKQKTSYANWIRMVSEFISKEEREVLNEEGRMEKKNFSDIISFSSHKKSELRKSASDALEDIFLKHLDVAEAEINNVMEDKKTDDMLRNYSRPDEERFLSDDIEPETVNSLIKSVSDSFDFSKEYYAFKAKLLGVDKLKYYERSVEYGDLNKKYSFEDAINLINRTFSNLDVEFASILSMYVSQGRFDVYPAKGKTGGAFCAHFGINDPTYILLNHTGRLTDVLTIAHEVGHGINNELVKSKQNGLNFGTPTSTAEVASTFMEDFVLEEIMRGLEQEDKLSLLMAKLDSDMSTIFRQVAFYNFEVEMHRTFREQGFLPKELLGNMFQKHMASYMGEAAEGAENWWVYVQHFRYYFYVYSYAGGLLISKSLQNMVKEDKNNVLKVKEFLSAGLSESPKNTFLRMGFDISEPEFWSKGLLETRNLFEMTKDMAHKLGKI